MQLFEQIQIDVDNQCHLGVGRGFGFDAVARKRKIRGRKHRRLRILNIHIIDLGQIADTTRDGDKTLVFDGSRLGTMFDSGVGVLRIGQEGYEQDIHPFIGH